MNYICSKCNIEKDESCFYFINNKPKLTCKECKISYQKQFYIDHKDRIEIYRQQYYSNNRDDILEEHKIKYDNMLSSEKIFFLEKKKEYRDKNKKFLNESKRIYIKTKKINDPSFKIKLYFSSKIHNALNGTNKDIIFIEQHLPYTIQELKEYLESKFEDWMTWKNWGKYNKNTWKDNDQSTWVWNIDHIIPQSKLKYDSLEHENFKICWGIANLRPYNAKQNLIDGDRR